MTRLLWASLALLSCTIAAPSRYADYPGTKREGRGLQARATTVPSGWTSLGCIADDGTARTLATELTDSTAMSVESCLATVVSKGYKYGGLSYGSQCWASNALARTTTSSACTMACPGNTAETCGGNWALNVYSYNAPVVSSGWTAMGCLADTTSPRLLAYEIADTTSMTPAVCQAACAAKGYIYAGLEYSSQCYCGSALTSTATSTGCTMVCSGDSSQICGGNWAATVYKLSSSTTSVPTSKASTTATSTSITKSTTSSAVAATTTGWTSLGCYSDGTSRALATSLSVTGSMTPTLCQTACLAAKYAYAGIEYGTQCYCGSTINSAQGPTSASSCSMACPGNSALTCGGSWALQMFKYSGAIPSTTSAIAASSTSKPVTTSATPSSTSSPSSTSTSAAVAYPTNAVPASTNANKRVWMHMIVGNTYGHTNAEWLANIASAVSGGVDGFILNYGTDSWQPSQIALAYAAAQSVGFKMALSPDLTAIGCGDSSNVQAINSLIGTYINHPAAAQYKGKSILTSFAGDSCTFGKGSVTAGWEAVMGSYQSSLYFMPAFLGGPTTLTGTYAVMDGDTNWGSCWPSGSTDLTTAADTYYQSIFGSNADYIATVAPLFYAHLSYKNSLWRSDNFLFAYRMEQIISLRGSIDQIEVLSGNDWGESTALLPIDPVETNWPAGSATYNIFDHTALLPLLGFYATAWKTGAYPAITKDKLWLSARPHTAAATASGDSIGRPNNTGWTQDNMYCQVHLTAAASVVLSTNSASQTYSGSPGINRFSFPMQVGSGISAKVVRNGVTTASLTPSGFTFVSNPQYYNFNYGFWTSS